LSLANPNPDRRDPLRPAPPAAAGRPLPICKSEDLLRGDRLLIRHGEETYILRLTKSGKLLLTK